MGLNKPIIITNSSVDISNLATKSDLVNVAKTSDLSGLAKTSDMSGLAKTSDLSGLAKTSDMSGLAKTSDLSGLAKTTDLANVGGAVRHIQRGTYTIHNNIVLSISLTGFSDVSKMFVVLQGAGLNQSQYGATLPYVNSLDLGTLKVQAHFGTNVYEELYGSYEVVEYY